ncbi:MAG TPA: sigma-70 family RNA polymerase sigma factor [Opitutaceae bacterium]|nr:sigma-70 family RNA polymerase sigma factor [Opitutaceae bacterium]
MAPDPAATTTPGEDTELMRRVQRGDESAFGVLLQRWERPVKSVIARLVFNSREAGDLAQETFVRVWQQREKFRPDAEFRPWVFSIALNLARNRLRWWRRRPNVSLEEWNEKEGAAEVGGGKREMGGSRALERAERAAAVRAAVAALPVDLREALVLFEYENLSHAEIAAALGGTPKAVESRIYRAREKLRHALSALSDFT